MSSRAWWHRSPVGHAWQREDSPEVGLEETKLRALESRLADARRLLLGAARVRGPHRGEARALAELAAELHHRVLEDLERPWTPAPTDVDALPIERELRERAERVDQAAESIRRDARLPTALQRVVAPEVAAALEQLDDGGERDPE